MRNQILESDFNQAVEDIKLFLLDMALKARHRGWSFTTTDKAPESYSALKAASVDKCIPIADYGSDTSIYGKEINTLFRFYHDVTHLENDWSFNKASETLTAEKHKADAIAFGLSPLALKILWADTFGQVEYYFKRKQFVNNQLDFVYMCLQVGINTACRINV